MPKRRSAPPPPTRADIGRAVVRYTPRSRQVLAEIAESAGSATLERPAQRVTVREATTGGAQVTRPGRLRIRLIRAGWSLNGNYYPAEVLKRDGAAAWPAGTQCFIDHATETEDEDRPAGSVKNLAAVLTEDAQWSDAENGLVAEVRLFAPWREAITDMAESIGMSIRAWVFGEPGEAEGRQGFVVSGIPEGRSVDFVTVPAAGGAILSVLESVQRQRADEARSIGVWLESRLHLALTQLGDELYGDGRLTREERITLSTAIGDGLQAWTARVEADAPQLFERDLWEDPPAPTVATATETQTTTTPPAAPVVESVTDGAPPAAPNPPTGEEPAMSGAQTGGQSPGEAGTAEARTATTSEAPAEARLAIVEAERDQLRTRAQGMSEQLAEAQADARRERARADEAIAEMRRLRANEAGRTTVDRMLGADESGVPAEMQGIIGPRVHAAILNHVPLTDDGTVDQAALEAAVTAAIRAERVHAASLLEAQGVGRVAGLGAEGDPTMQMTQQQFEGGLSDVFKSIGLDESVAKLAAKGR